MPAALDRLTREAHIAPVDLAQASIGPGMEIYSRYKSIKKRQENELVDVSVREALVAINNEIDKYLEKQEGEFDSYTRFCLRWFMQHGFDEGTYGDADTLAKAINVGVAPMRGRLLTAEENVVKLLRPDDYDSNHPNAELSLQDITTWEACHLMIYHLNPDNEDGQEVSGAADVARRMRGNPALNSSVESVERLAWILFNYYDKQDDSWNAMLCNNLVNAWTSIESKMREALQESLPFATE
jgi:putative DNA methylase